MLQNQIGILYYYDNEVLKYVMNSTINLYDQCFIVYLMSTYENIQVSLILHLKRKSKDELPAELLLFLSILLHNYNSLY